MRERTGMRFCSGSAVEPRRPAISGQCGGEGDDQQALPVLSPVYMFNDKVSEEEVRAIWLDATGAARSAHEVDQGV